MNGIVVHIANGCAGAGQREVALSAFLEVDEYEQRSLGLRQMRNCAAVSVRRRLVASNFSFTVATACENVEAIRPPSRTPPQSTTATRLVILRPRLTDVCALIRPPPLE